MTRGKILVYLFRRDLRVADNPILHHLATTPDHGFSHLLPIFVFPHHQIELSGLVKEGAKSPYPPAVSQVGKFWRCGPHRAKFLTHSLWDLKTNLEELGSGLVLRAGAAPEVLKSVFEYLQDKHGQVGAVWMTEEKSWEEVEEQKALASVCADHQVDFALWRDEKYFIDDRDTGLKSPKELPDIFTTYRKSQEPLRSRPRKALPQPDKSSLPPLPDQSLIAPQQEPFVIPDSRDELENGLIRPLWDLMANPPPCPKEAQSAHPFLGGETRGQDRMKYLIRSGHMSTYKETRNGLVGPDFSTKLSAYLALGCITARQVHHELVKFEDGKDKAYADTPGYGHGENQGTTAIRFELLWRDYMRLCTMKFGPALFRQSGFRRDKNYTTAWKTADKKTAPPNQDPSPDAVASILQRFLDGTTGLGLIDASQRELFHTGYTSNRARQNVASFWSKHLGIDWRYGAEWYEMLLVDYDVSSNWANWQYVAGVGNDPRGEARIFNPIKQAFDYDKDGHYVRSWVPELKELKKQENLFQVCTTSFGELKALGLANNIMVRDPVKRIEFTLARRPRNNRKPFPRRRGNGNGGGGGGGGGYSGSYGRGDGSSGANGNGGYSGGDYNAGGGGYGPAWDSFGSQYQQQPHVQNHGNEGHGPTGHGDFQHLSHIQMWGGGFQDPYAGNNGGLDAGRNNTGEWYNGFNDYNNRGHGNHSFAGYGGRGSGERRGGGSGGPPRGRFHPEYPPTSGYMPSPGVEFYPAPPPPPPPPPPHNAGPSHENSHGQQGPSPWGNKV